MFDSFYFDFFKLHACYVTLKYYVGTLKFLYYMTLDG